MTKNYYSCRTLYIVGASTFFSFRILAEQFPEFRVIFWERDYDRAVKTSQARMQYTIDITIWINFFYFL